MTFALWTQFHIERPWGQVATFNQEKALVGAFSVITNLRMELFEALHYSHHSRSSAQSLESEGRRVKDVCPGSNIAIYCTEKNSLSINPLYTFYT